MDFLLILFFGCQKAEHNESDTASEKLNQTTDSGVSSYDDPWPEGEVSWDNYISVVHDGVLISPDESLSVISAPAGVDHNTSIQFTITNRSEEVLSFNTDPNAWNLTDSLTMINGPDTHLAPDESAQVTVQYNPINMREGTLFSHPISFPIEEIEYILQLEVTIPNPLRVVFSGDNGYTLASDDYGESIFYEFIPEDIGQTMLTMTWGNGTFIRGSRFGDWFSDAYYEYSNDGIVWLESAVASGGWPFACEYGLDTFLCVRSFGAYLSHSSDGTLFLHESASAEIGTFISSLVFTGEHFVGVGRDGCRAVATGSESFDAPSVLYDETIGNLDDIAYGDGLLIAVGGAYANQQTISISSDGGYSWIDQTASSGTGHLDSIAYGNGIWVAHGESSTDYAMYRSYDGFTWEPLPEFGHWDGYRLLGSHNGWFFGIDRSNSALYRSNDGENWEEMLLFPEGMSVITMAAEQWTQP